jgi:ribosomal protein L11 methyltransferase
MTNPSWLEISFILDGELAEAVAEVLGRYVSGGVVIESTAVTASADDSQGRATGPLRVCGYLPVDDQLEEARRRLEEALWFLGRIRPLPAPSYRSLPDQDWSQAWKQNYRPILVGERLVVVPAWLESPDPTRVALRIDPGMAFGTGTHPTTQLCLEVLDAFYNDIRNTQFDDGRFTMDDLPQAQADLGQQLPTTVIGPPSVIDLGCGSGILAIAALKLGAQQALGVDIDEDAVQATKSNAALNGVSDQLEVGLGSLGEIRRGDFTLRQAHLVLANILAPVIVGLLDENLGDLLAPDGVLVLSGLLADQAGEVEAALERHAMQCTHRRQSGDWVALVAQH